MHRTEMIGKNKTSYEVGNKFDKKGNFITDTGVF